MARQKRKSPAIENADVRAAALTSISPTLDLGNGLTVVAYKAAIANGQTLLDAYNTLLSQADHALNALVAAEKGLLDLSERMLGGVGSKFGKDSSQYEMAGGTRKSEKKKPKRKPKPA